LREVGFSSSRLRTFIQNAAHGCGHTGDTVGGVRRGEGNGLGAAKFGTNDLPYLTDKEFHSYGPSEEDFEEFDRLFGSKSFVTPQELRRLNENFGRKRRHEKDSVAHSGRTAT
jgi:hypothetical protein